MSDDDYAVAEDDFTADEALDGAATETEADPDAEEDLDEMGLDEDAAGTDADSDAEEAGPEDFADEPGQARPTRPSPNPPQSKSNKAVTAIIVHPDERVTDHCLRRTEAAEILAMRAQEISKFGKSFVDPAGLHDPVAIAYKELFERRCPLLLRRFVGSGPAGEPVYEEWDPNTMTHPPLVPPAALGGPRGAGSGAEGRTPA